MNWLHLRMVCKSIEAAKKRQPGKHQVTLYGDTTLGRVKGRMLPKVLSCSSIVLVTCQYGSENVDSQRGKTTLHIRKHSFLSVVELTITAQRGTSLVNRLGGNDLSREC